MKPNFDHRTYVPGIVKATTQYKVYKRVDGEWKLMAYAPNADCAVRTAHALGGAIRFEYVGEGRRAA